MTNQELTGTSFLDCEFGPRLFKAHLNEKVEVCLAHLCNGIGPVFLLSISKNKIDWG